MADSPLSELKKLPTWGKVAIGIGGVVVAWWAYTNYENAQAANAAATTSTADETASADTVTDPTTGETYSADAVDPDTGMTYAEEIDDYGSVESAEEAVGGGAYGIDDLEAEDAGLADEGYIGDYYDTGATGEAGSYATNAAWSQAVEAGLTDLGYSSTDIATALGYYLAGRPLTTLPDGTSSYDIILAALAEYGTPPQGSFSVIAPSSTNPASTNIAVPDVTGDPAADAQSAIQDAGLVYSGPSSGTVASQSPAAGTTVATGSTVTVTMTPATATTTSTPPPSTTTTSTPETTTSNLVTVPNEVGRTDLDTAKSMIEAAGLVAKETGDSSAGNLGSVTSQSPAAGTQVPKGTAVTLTYTVANAVTVPNEVGRADLDTAEQEIEAAGLKATASAASVAASKGNKGKVTSQSPAAGSKVAKGTTVTLVYTK